MTEAQRITNDFNALDLSDRKAYLVQINVNVKGKALAPNRDCAAACSAANFDLSQEHICKKGVLFSAKPKRRESEDNRQL